jgi:transcriptional antiterminator
MINKDSVVSMTKMGFTQKEIAERLGCSTRQIRRVLKEIGSSSTGNSRIDIDQDTESTLREFMLTFSNGERAANSFGITRQAILK